MNTKRKLVLYFIDGPAPSELDLANVDAIIVQHPRHNVTFRNAQSHGPTDPVESSDFVAGCVPEAYKGTKALEFKPVKLKEKEKDEDEKNPPKK